MNKICGVCSRIDNDTKLDDTHYYCKEKRTYVDIMDFPDRCYDFYLDSSICGTCPNFDWNNKESYATRFRCEGICRYVSPWDKQYYCNHKKSYSGNSNESTNNSYTPGGCYITTLVHNILGYSDDCELLRTFRMFRDNVLKCDFNYIDLLFQYDIIGPQISDKLRDKKDNYNFSLQVCHNYLIPCIKAVKEGFISEAVRIYNNMLTYLCTTFNIELVKPEQSLKYDMLNLGKARQRKLGNI